MLDIEGYKEGWREKVEGWNKVWIEAKNKYIFLEGKMDGMTDGREDRKWDKEQ